MIEKIINYQNNSERSFENKKNLKTVSNYLVALVLFFLSTIISAFSFPIRFLYKTTTRKKVNSKIIELQAENIESVLKDNQYVLIDFWAEWCGPCLMMNSIIKKFATQSKGIQVAKVNADLNAELMKEFKVKGLPQFIFIKNTKEIKRNAGAMTLDQLNKFCNNKD